MLHLEDLFERWRGRRYDKRGRRRRDGGATSGRYGAACAAPRWAARRTPQRREGGGGAVRGRRRAVGGAPVPRDCAGRAALECAVERSSGRQGARCAHAAPGWAARRPPQRRVGGGGAVRGRRRSAGSAPVPRALRRARRARVVECLSDPMDKYDEINELTKQLPYISCTAYAHARTQRPATINYHCACTVRHTRVRGAHHNTGGHTRI